MTINFFDVQKEIYSFITTGISTSEHQHPILEIITSEQIFGIEINNQTYQTKAAIIPPNFSHKLMAGEQILHILMIENEQLIDFVYQYIGIEEDCHELPNHIEISLLEEQLINCKITPIQKIDSRVVACKKLIKENDLSDSLSLEMLSKAVFLSTSRLSHLFKQEVGITIRQYQRWIKLRNTIHILLNQEISLLEACYQAGFYDMAHFSKAFQQSLGINASSIYNSRLIQI